MVYILAPQKTGISKYEAMRQAKLAQKEAKLLEKSKNTGLTKFEKVELASIKLQNIANGLSDVFDHSVKY